MSNFTKTQSVTLGILLAIFLILGYVIALPYITTLLLATILAFVFEPFYGKMLKVLKYRGLSSFVIVLIVLFIFLIPITFMGTLVFNESQNIYSSISSNGNISGTSGLISFINQKLNGFLPVGWGPWNVEQYISNVLEWMVGSLGGVFSSLASGIVTFAFSLLLLFYFLKDSASISEYISKHGPLSSKYMQILIDKVKHSITAVVKGSLVIALLQGIATGIGFAVFGIPNPALWGGIATIAALVPTFGTSLVIAPAVVYLFFSGSYFSAIGILIWGILAVGLLDNFLGPQLVKKGAGLHPVFILIGVLGGVGLFGPIGFILGPVVFSVLFAILDIYSVIWQDEENN